MSQLSRVRCAAGVSFVCVVVGACGGRTLPVVADDGGGGADDPGLCIASAPGPDPSCSSKGPTLECFTYDELLSAWKRDHATMPLQTDECGCVPLSAHFTNWCCGDAVDGPFYYGAKCCYHFCDQWCC